MKLNSVRGRDSMRALGQVVLALALLAAFIILFIFFYMQRYITYSADGAKMGSSATLAVANEQAMEVTISPVIVYEDPIPAGEADPNEPVVLPELTQLNAVYVSYEELMDVPTLRARLSGLEYTGLVIQVKRDHGNLAWPSNIAGASDYVEGGQEVADFFNSQAEAGKYMVAQVSCFRDDLFALDHQSEGLPITGGALWVDSDNYYWMSPESPSALNYIVEIGRELKGYGFSELLLNNFQYPTTGSPSNIVYSSSTGKIDAINTGADLVISSLAALGMRTSIQCDSSSCQTGANTAAGFDMASLTGKFDRIYVNLDVGGNIGGVVDGLIMASGGKVYMDRWLVFITSSNDTRFNDYGYAKING